MWEKARCLTASRLGTGGTPRSWPAVSMRNRVFAVRGAQHGAEPSGFGAVFSLWLCVSCASGRPGSVVMGSSIRQQRARRRMKIRNDTRHRYMLPPCNASESIGSRLSDCQLSASGFGLSAKAHVAPAYDIAVLAQRRRPIAESRMRGPLHPRGHGKVADNTDEPWRFAN